MIFSVGYRFQDFELQHFLGGGQDGEVWLAKRMSIGNAVAIKFLKAIEEDKVTRFEREIAVLASLQHPHIITIHQRDSAPDPMTHVSIPCYIMDFLEGDRLDDALLRISDRRARFEACCEFLVQIVGALQAAHALQITHGDIKPGNILVARHAPTARLADFGFALLAGEQRTRVEYPSSSFHAPAAFSPEEADIFDVGKTIEVLLPLLDGPAYLASALHNLAAALTAIPQRATLDDAMARLQDAKEAAVHATFVPTHASPPRGTMSILRDMIYGYVEVPDRVLTLLGTAPFQRLRSINLYPNEERVYPALNITAFEQAIADYAAVKGCLSLITEPTITSVVTPSHVEVLLLLALLRHAATPPFASVLATMFPRPELEALTSATISTSPISDVIERDWHLVPSELVALLFDDRSKLPSPDWRVATWFTRSPYGPAGLEWVWRINHRLGTLVSRDDARYYRRLTREASDLNLALPAGRRDVISEFLHLVESRLRITETVLVHRRVRAANAMLRTALETLHVEQLAFLLRTPSQQEFLTAALRIAERNRQTGAAQLINDLDNWQLFQTAHVSAGESRSFDASAATTLRSDIASGAGVRVSDVLVDVVPKITLAQPNLVPEEHSEIFTAAFDGLARRAQSLSGVAVFASYALAEEVVTRIARVAEELTHA